VSKGSPKTSHLGGKKTWAKNTKHTPTEECSIWPQQYLYRDDGGDRAWNGQNKNNNVDSCAQIH
jgi:hypothetical protein